MGYRNHHRDDNDDDHMINNERICIIVFGVGITEGLPVARKELERITEKEQQHDNDGEKENINNKVTVLWASRTMGDTFWHDQIEELEEKYAKDKFEFVHILSREQPEYCTEAGCYHGRINPTVLKEVFQLEEKEEDKKSLSSSSSKPLFLSVATKEMMRMTYDMLSSMGYP